MALNQRSALAQARNVGATPFQTAGDVPRNLYGEALSDT